MLKAKCKTLNAKSLIKKVERLVNYALGIMHSALSF